MTHHNTVEYRVLYEGDPDPWDEMTLTTTLVGECTVELARDSGERKFIPDAHVIIEALTPEDLRDIGETPKEGTEYYAVIVGEGESERHLAA